MGMVETSRTISAGPRRTTSSQWRSNPGIPPSRMACGWEPCVKPSNMLGTTRTPRAGIGSKDVPRLHLDRLDFADKPAGVLGGEGGHDTEHGVTEAADVQDVAAILGLGRGDILNVGGFS